MNIWHEVEDRVRFVIDNLSTYWHQLAASVVAACEDQETSFDLSLFEWCALGALRLHYTAFTGDVTSKRGAGEYGIVVTPDYMHDTLRATLAARSTRLEGDRWPRPDHGDDRDDAGSRRRDQLDGERGTPGNGVKSRSIHL